MKDQNSKKTLKELIAESESEESVDNQLRNTHDAKVLLGEDEQPESSSL